MNKNSRFLKSVLRNKPGKLGALLGLILSVTILIVNIVSASYSWFSPGKESGSGVTFQQSDYMRSEMCSFTLYQGEIVDGAVKYSKKVQNNASQTDIDNGKAVISTTVAAAGSTDKTIGLHYYQIEIANDDRVNGTDISLYLVTAPGTGISASIPANVTLGVVTPSNSCYTYDSTKTSINIVRNAYVKKYVETEVDPGILRVAFFIRSSTAFSFDERNILLVYN